MPSRLYIGVQLSCSSFYFQFHILIFCLFSMATVRFLLHIKYTVSYRIVSLLQIVEQRWYRDVGPDSMPLRAFNIAA